MATLTQEQWELFKREFPNDEKIQSITFEELAKNVGADLLQGTKGRSERRRSADLLQSANVINVDLSSPPPITQGQVRGLESLPEIDDCTMCLGYVIFDVICLAFAGWGVLRGGVRPNVIVAVAKAASPQLAAIKDSIVKLADEKLSPMDRAGEVFNILKNLWIGGILGAVLRAFMGSLDWWSALLYSATALTTLAAAFGTGGVVLVANIAGGLISFTYLAIDAKKLIDTCGFVESSTEQPVSSQLV